MQIHCPALPHVFSAPDGLVDGFPVQGDIAVPGKKKQQVKFFHCKLYRLPILQDSPGCRINHHIEYIQHSLRLMISAQNCFHPGQKLHDFKRFGQIIIRPHPQPFYFILRASQGCQENHRQLQCPGIFHQLIAIDPGKHHIQKQEIKFLIIHVIRRLLSIRSPGAVVSGSAQIHSNQICDRLLVLRNQYLQHDLSPQGSLFVWFSYKLCVPHVSFLYPARFPTSISQREKLLYLKEPLLNRRMCDCHSILQMGKGSESLSVCP